MNKVKKYFVSYFILFCFSFIFLFILNLINYFDILSIRMYFILLFIFINISVFISCFHLGRNTLNKGFKSGIIFGFCFVIFLVFLSIVFNGFRFKLSSFLYYISIMITSFIASILGINSNKKTEK